MPWVYIGIIVIGSVILLGLYDWAWQETKFWRAAAVEWDKTRKNLLETAAQLAPELKAVTDQVQGNWPEPYAPLYHKGQVLAGRAEELLAKITGAKQTPAARLSSVSDAQRILVLPLVIEFGQRWNWYRQLNTLLHQYETAQTSIQQIKAIIVEIAELGRAYKLKTGQLRNQLQTLHHKITTERRSALALAEATQQLTLALQLLSQASALLNAADPPKAQVIKAYPQINQAEAIHHSVMQKVAEQNAALQQAERRLIDLTARLSAIQTFLIQEERAQRPLPQLRTQAAQAGRQIEKQRALIQGGDLPPTVQSINDLAQTLTQLEKATKSLQAMRQQAARQVEAASQWVTESQRWLKQRPPFFNMIQTKSQITEMEAYIEKLQLARASENPRALLTLKPPALQPTARHRSEFEKLEAKFNGLVQAIHAAQVPSLITQAEICSNNLKTRSIRYRQQGNLSGLLDCLERVRLNWQSFSPTTPVEERAFKDRVEALSTFDEAIGQLQSGCSLVDQTLQTIEREIRAARESLNQFTLANLRTECLRLIEDGDDHVKQLAQAAINKHEHFTSLLQAGDTDYNKITEAGHRLQTDVNRLMHEAETRLGKLDPKVSKLRAELLALQGEIGRQRQRGLVFHMDEQSTLLRSQLNDWLTSYDRLNQSSLKAMTLYWSEGMLLRDQLGPQVEAIRQNLRSLDQAQTNAQRALDRADVALQNAAQTLGLTAEAARTHPSLSVAYANRDLALQIFNRLLNTQSGLSLDIALMDADAVEKLATGVYRSIETISGPFEN